MYLKTNWIPIKNRNESMFIQNWENPILRRKSREKLIFIWNQRITFITRNYSKAISNKYPRKSILFQNQNKLIVIERFLWLKILHRFGSIKSSIKNALKKSLSQATTLIPFGGGQWRLVAINYERFFFSFLDSFGAIYLVLVKQIF